MDRRLYCGAGKQKITPPMELLPKMMGLGQAVFGDILDDLYVRTILFQSDGKRAMMVSFDLDKAPYPEEYVRELSEKTQVPKENILFFSIHTHTAPLAGARPFEPLHDITKKPEDVQKAVKRYEDLIHSQVVKAAEEAAESLRPARMGYGWGKSYVNVNRCFRYCMADQGISICETGYDGDGPVSRDAFVLKVEDLEGNPIAFFMNYAVHCVVMFKNDRGDGTSCISSDLGGNVSQYMEAKFPGSVAVWSSGAAGDINPVLMSLNIYPDPGTGEPVSAPVQGLDVSRTLLESIAGRHFADLLGISRKIKCAREQAEISGIIGWVRVQGAENVLETEEYILSNKPYEVRMHLVRIGDVAFMGINGELYTTLGEAVRAASPMKNTVIINHEASMLPGNPGYILDDETVAKCRQSSIVRLPHSGFRALPGQLEQELKKKTEKLFQKLL